MRAIGVYGSENVGMSSVKSGEKPLVRKANDSYPMFFRVG